jgi:hypothetical protein
MVDGWVRCATGRTAVRATAEPSVDTRARDPGRRSAPSSAFTGRGPQLTLTRSRTADGIASGGASGRGARYLPNEVPGKLAQRNRTPARDTAAVDGWHELSVANPTFLLERLGSECTDLQGLRELTVNGLDAIAALGDRAGGRVVWDMDWQRFDASGGRVRKLSVTDTGMAPEQLRQYINQLASSGREQSATGNFGVGAKLAAGSRNPHGLEYRSWHRGQGALVCFKRHPNGRWGLEPQRGPDSRSDFWRPLGEQDKPWLLRGQDHGSQVVLLGRHERHDTIQPPGSVTDARRRWITRYLNGRFLRLPEQVEVLVRDQQCQRRELQHIQGERHHLKQRAIAAGAEQLSDAIARWWVLDDHHRGRRREAAIWASTGHAAAVYDDELYDILPQTRGGYGRLQDFGIRFGYERVVLHVHPHVQAGRLQCNTARTLLLLDHEPLPWARWGEEFAAAMPAEIRQLQERAASADAVPRQEAIRQRVTAIMPLYRLSRYRPPRTPRVPDTVPAISEPMRSQHVHHRSRVRPARHASARMRIGPHSTSTLEATSPAAMPMRSPPSRRQTSPTWRGSPAATAPGRSVTSRIRPPATTPRDTSPPSTPTSALSPTWSTTGAGATRACRAPAP